MSVKGRVLGTTKSQVLRKGGCGDGFLLSSSLSCLPPHNPVRNVGEITSVHYVHPANRDPLLQGAEFSGSQGNRLSLLRLSGHLASLTLGVYFQEFVSEMLPETAEGMGTRASWGGSMDGLSDDSQAWAAIISSRYSWTPPV